MKYLLTLIIALNCVFVNAQKLKSNDIIILSKELLIESVGVELIKYFDFSKPNGSYYKLEKNRFDYKPTKSLEPNRKLRKNWTEIYVLWHFKFPKIKGIQSGLWVKINKELKLMEPIELDYIPEFVWENKPCDFITIQEAIEIGNKNLTKTKFERTEPELSFDNKRNKYIYTIINKVTSEKDIYGKERGTTEILEINALTGKTYELKQGYHGIVIR